MRGRLSTCGEKRGRERRGGKGREGRRSLNLQGGRDDQGRGEEGTKHEVEKRRGLSKKIEQPVGIRRGERNRSPVALRSSLRAEQRSSNSWGGEIEMKRRRKRPSSLRVV
jgi:hypothetical protein